MLNQPGLVNKVVLKPKVLVTQKQIQALQIITLPTDALESRIEQELEDNPVLELVGGIDEAFGYGHERNKEREDNLSDAHSSTDDMMLGDFEQDTGTDEIDTDDPIGGYEEIQSLEEEHHDCSYEDEYLRDYIDDDPASYLESSGSYNPDSDDRTMPIAVEKSYHEYLCEQLDLLNFESNQQRLIAEQIVGNIDNHGYLTREIDGIVKDLRVYHNIQADKNEVRSILYKIQRFDPPGTGARDLRECLLIQLRLLRENTALRTAERQMIEAAYLIIDEHFEEFKKKHYSRLQRVLGLKDSNDLIPYINLILKLNPKPASGFATRDSGKGNYITPDFIIQNLDGELQITLNARNAPELRINDAYRDQLRSYQEKKANKSVQASDLEAYTFIKSKIDSARSFIDAIKQRQDTMMRTMSAILNHQYEYFKTGDVRKMKPMILKDISEVTDLDISTVSRVANSKYVQTEFGTKRIKDFFSESLQTEDGEEVSTLEVKEIMKDIISKESHTKPLSDEKIRSMLQRKGYNIARRTVAKYRESLNIPVARMRKGLVA